MFEWSWRDAGRILIEEEYSPDEGLSGLWEETNGLNSADANVPVDEEVLNKPSYKGLNYYRDSTVAC